eukprot:scaffold3834_cov179-Ochromonas_danica.AAC.5
MTNNSQCSSQPFLFGCINSLIQKGSAVNKKDVVDKQHFTKPSYSDTLTYLTQLQGKRKARDEEYRTSNKILKLIMFVSVVCWAAVLALVIKHHDQAAEGF